MPSTESYDACHAAQKKNIFTQPYISAPRSSHKMHNSHFHGNSLWRMNPNCGLWHSIPSDPHLRASMRRCNEPSPRRQTAELFEQTTTGRSGLAHSSSFVSAIHRWLENANASINEPAAVDMVIKAVDRQICTRLRVEENWWA